MRIFSPEYRNYSQVATMSSLRWYPTVMTFPDGNMLILGGNQAVSSALVALPVHSHDSLQAALMPATPQQYALAAIMTA